MLLISVYDKNLKTWGNVYSYPNRVAIERDFKIVFSTKSKDNIYTMFPEQFSIYIVGSFDDETGKVTPLNEFLYDLSSFVVDVSKEEKGEK